jgi:phenylalanyl-tRNA synthetase beta chain
MKFTLSWLKEHLDTTASLDEIRERLTMLGLEVEGITNAAEALRGFVVGYVVEAKQHPNADRLRVCTVDTGSGVVQVVCGAPNARTGMKGIFAPTGSTIPGTALLLKASKIRGEDSNGMLCSSRELQLGDDHSGIIDLPADAKTGAPAAEALGLDDPVIEIKVTPNRGDCLGVHGIARDLAAAGAGTLKPMKADKIQGTFKSPIKWTHGYEPKPDSPCPLVVGRYFRGVKNGPSPDWLQRRLKAIGLRPISALVDITNLVTFDLNRPLHVFDAKKLSGDLVMRQARAGETILALDGKTYTLDPAVSVIADSKGPHGIGGVMGGEDTGVREDTTDVFLEVAYFTPMPVAATGRKLGILSDARYRFERGIDPQSCWWGAEVAARLILELCGGETSEVVSSGVMPNWERSYTLRADRVQKLTAIDVPARETADILGKLGFGVTGNGPWTAAVPSWRPDVIGEADLVEEVTRVYGFDHIPTTSLPRLSATSKPVRTPLQQRVPQARRALGAGHERGRDLVVHGARQGRAFRRGPAGRPAPPELDRRHARHHAPGDPAQPDRCGGPQRSARSCRSCPVRGRADLPRRHAAGPADGRGRRAPSHGGAAQLARSGAHGRCVRRQGRCARRVGGDRRARQSLDPAGRARLVPSRPLGCAEARRQGDGVVR